MIRIAGTGCALADYLYTKARFNSPKFTQYQSKCTGDGGLSPGKLVFTEELEKFAEKPYSQILPNIIGDTTYDNANIGGPSLVALIHASQLLPQNDYEVSFYGCTGNDDTAKLIVDLVNKTPLNIDNYIALGDKRTAFTDVLSDPTYDDGNGERTFINNIGASWDYTPEMLPESFFEADIVCFGGTALVPQIHDNLTALLQKAKANNCITVVNTVFDFRNEKKNPNKCWPLGDCPETYKLIDVLLMDCEEALKISGSANIDEAAIYFSKQDLSSFIITNGSKNIYAYSSGRLFNSVELVQLPVSETIKNQLKENSIAKGDTTGCGDNFAGGIIASLAWQVKNLPSDKYDLFNAVSWGVASGGYTCFYVGGTYIEQNEGEKLEKIIPYQKEYLEIITSR
jgi:sugar/nucleoside kinase (ribokinase family)